MGNNQIVITREYLQLLVENINWLYFEEGVIPEGHIVIGTGAGGFDGVELREGNLIRAYGGVISQMDNPGVEYSDTTNTYYLANVLVPGVSYLATWLPLNKLKLNLTRKACLARA